MSDTSANRSSGQSGAKPPDHTGRVPFVQTASELVSWHLHSPALVALQPFWPRFVQGRASFDARHHATIRSFRSFASDSGPAPSPATVGAMCDIAASLYAQSDRPVRSDFVSSICQVCLDLLRSDLAPTGPLPDAVASVLGLPSDSSRLCIERVLASLLDYLLTGSPYVRPDLGLRVSCCLGLLASVVRLARRDRLKPIVQSAAGSFALLGAYAAFAGAVGPASFDIARSGPAPTITLKEDDLWTLRATFQPAFRVVLASDRGTSRFTASGSWVSTLCSVFLCDPAGPSIGPVGLTLVYPSSEHAGALRGARGEIPLSSRAFVCMQRLVDRYMRDPGRLRWSSQIHSLYGDI